VPATASIPVVDLGADDATVTGRIDAACREVGFFGVIGHGVDERHFDALDAAARSFFALPDAVKSEIAMARAGAAWRGWFPVGGELTDGVADVKEGLYVGTEHGDDHPLVRCRAPLHGRNLFPTSTPDLGPSVIAWMAEMRPLAERLLRHLAVALGRPPTWFADHLTSEPTELFRIFHYPPGGDANAWGVAEHSDYGLLTLLAQDDVGGLEVQTVDGAWIGVEPQPGLIVCNLGDMLQAVSGGRYRSTRHRVRNLSDVGRFSFPYFFDPDWHVTVPGTDVTYGDYITAKVARVFPDLFASATDDPPDRALAQTPDRFTAPDRLTASGSTPRSPGDGPHG
jgi:isopenicillin N synthase-like dioxygenase